MSIFKVGMQVRVITQDETEHYGEVGRIRNVYDADPHRPFEVDFGDELEEFDADEIEPVILVQLAPAEAPAAADAAPAAPARGEGTLEAILPTLLSGITPDAKAKILAGYIDARVDSLGSERDNLKALLATSEAEAARLRERVRVLEAAVEPFAFCPIHPSWADDTRCVIIMNWRQPGLEVSVNEGLKLADMRRAVAAYKARRGAE